jgi:hypothetical protein
VTVSKREKMSLGAPSDWRRFAQEYVKLYGTMNEQLFCNWNFHKWWFIPSYMVISRLGVFGIFGVVGPKTDIKMP